MVHKLRHVGIAGAVAFALLLVACGGDSGTSTTTAQPGTTGPSTTKALATAPGFDGKTIKVGLIEPLSGSAAIIGNPVTAGQEVFWKSVNEQGGIAGKYKVETVLEDNQYETNITVQKYTKMKNDVVMFASVLGTAPNLALLPQLKEDNKVASPASQDAMWVRQQQLFPVIEPYQIDVINAFDYYINNGGQGKTVCAIIQNDVYGEAGLEGLQFVAKADGFNIAATTRFKVGDKDFTAQITEMKKANCEAVLATALPTEFGAILGTGAQLGFLPRWIAQSPAWVDELLGTALKDLLVKYVWVAAVGPQWGDTSYPGVTKELAAIAKYKPDQQPDYYFSFGYYQADAVSQLLTKAVELGDLSPAGIVTAMNSLEKIDFGGLVGNYAYGPPEKRNPPRLSTVFQINPAIPFGLETVKGNFTTKPAQDFVFPAASQP